MLYHIHFWKNFILSPFRKINEKTRRFGSQPRSTSIIHRVREVENIGLA
jgi:hypothetical protein